MSTEEKVYELKENGKSYREISKILNIPLGSAKGFYYKAKNKERLCTCLNCGKQFLPAKGKRTKKFCSDSCRSKWWNSHKDLIKKKIHRENTCLFCGKKFISYGNRVRKYCCRDCYERAHQGEHKHE